MEIMSLLNAKLKKQVCLIIIFFINYFHYKYEDKSDKDKKSYRWTMYALRFKKLRWVWIRESRFRKCFMKWLSLEGYPPQAFNYYFMFGRYIYIYVMQYVTSTTNHHGYMQFWSYISKKINIFQIIILLFLFFFSFFFFVNHLNSVIWI